MSSSSIRKVTILGATGSIGCSTLEVISEHSDQYQVYALTAHTRLEELLSQCRQFRPSYAVMTDSDQAEILRDKLSQQDLPTRVLSGVEGLIQVATADDVDVLVAAIVGAAGLEPTLAAAKKGKTILLANKESLVTAGSVFMNAVSVSGAQLLPIDSEHSAIYQCMPMPQANGKIVDSGGVRKIILTASGGPFRDWSCEQMAAATVEQACAHPNWDMGRKISVDSATMMNKGLELIEACWLFNVPPKMVEIVVHPQSIVHSMVEYRDGSVLAQMGNPDMRIPIAYGLAWPRRIESGVASLDLINAANLEFEAPDYERFPCLRLAREAAEAGGTAMAVLNAANEEAVAAFLDERIGFTDIAVLIEQVMTELKNTAKGISEPQDLDVVKAADAEARALANDILNSRSRGQ